MNCPNCENEFVKVVRSSIPQLTSKASRQNFRVTAKAEGTYLPRKRLFEQGEMKKVARKTLVEMGKHPSTQLLRARACASSLESSWP